MPDLADYVSGLLHEADVQVEAVDAWALPVRPRAQRANFPRRSDYPGRIVVVSAKIEGRYVAARSRIQRSEEHTSELQSLMRISYAVFCLKQTTNNNYKNTPT